MKLQQLRQHRWTRIGAGVFMLVFGTALSIGLVDFGSMHAGHAHHH